MQVRIDAQAVLDNGGMTLWTTRAPQERGYMVSQSRTEEKYSLYHYSTKELADVMSRYATVHYMDGHAVGFWVDGHTLYCDVSHHIPNRIEAMATAIAHGQLAMYCLHRQEVVTC